MKERERGRERSSQDTLGSANSIKSDGNTSGIPPTLVLTTCNLKRETLHAKLPEKFRTKTHNLLIIIRNMLLTYSMHM